MRSIEIPRGDRLPVHVLVRTLNMPEHKVLTLLEKLSIPVAAWPSGEQMTSKTGIRHALLGSAGMPND